jgi:hypothetical protein
MIASVRRMGTLVPDAMPALTKALRAESERTIAAGTTAYGEKWALTQEGEQPLQHAVNALRVMSVNTHDLRHGHGRGGAAPPGLRPRRAPARHLADRQASRLDGERHALGARASVSKRGEAMSTLALENLFNQVVTSFQADGIHAVNVFGWREPTKHPGGPRIAWVPGDPSNAAGVSTAPRGPGGFPRALFSFKELFTVYFTAQDPSDPENEQVQYHIVRNLHQAWLRAVYHIAHGTFTIRSEGWETKRSERRHGATLRLVCEILAPVLDILPDPPLIGDGVDQINIVDAVQDAINHGTTIEPALSVLLNDESDSPAVVFEEVTYLGEVVTYLGEPVVVPI